MADITSFLSAELTEIGLVAAADPHFAERLLEALQRLPAEGAGEPVSAQATAAERAEELCA
jgi:hypothetical protein